jgi:hypothetical protein
MAFPSGPSNNQVATVGGITYIYNSTKGAWVRTVSSGTNLTANSLTISSGATSTTTTTGAVIVTGGVGVGGSMNVGGTVTAATLVGNFTGTISSGQVTTALGFTPYNATNPSGYITAVPNASTQVTSLGVGTAASGTTGEIRATNNITAYFSSDARLKENVRTIPDALDKVASIGGKLFDWTDDYINKHGGLDEYFLHKSDFGVIAQDVEQVFPEAVRKRSDGYLAVDYEKLCALAFQAIVELKSEIDSLKSK